MIIYIMCKVSSILSTDRKGIPLSTNKTNEEQIITSYPIDGAMGRFRSYRWFVYITTSLLREASWLRYWIVGHPNPASAPSILLILLEPHCVKTNRIQTLHCQSDSSNFAPAMKNGSLVRNKAVISSMVLFLVSGSFMYAYIQKNVNRMMKGTKL